MKNGEKSLFLEVFIVIVVMAACCRSFFVVRSFTNEDVNQGIFGVTDLNENEDNNINDSSKEEENNYADELSSNDILLTGNSVELKKGTEIFTLDMLVLNFIGEKKKVIDGDGGYQYTLDIVLNGKKVDLNIFGNKNNKVIWSNNYAVSFRVVGIDNYYILISYIAMQNDSNYVLILGEDGQVLKSFEDVGIVINKDELTLEITDCVSNGIAIECPSKVYNL